MPLLEHLPYSSADESRQQTEKKLNRLQCQSDKVFAAINSKLTQLVVDRQQITDNRQQIG